MAQTVRSQGPYDRVWLPGSSPDRNEKAGSSKIEYLEDRRRAKAAAAKAQSAGLQYDFNFSKAAARHSDRQPHAPAPSPVRQIPKGIGGRQRTAQPKKAPAAPRKKPSQQNGKPPQIKEPAEGQRIRRPAAQPKKSPSARGLKTKEPETGKKQKRPVRTEGKPAAKKSAGTPRRAQERPQRDTVTDFHSVTPDPRALKSMMPKNAKKKPSGNAKRNPSGNAKKKQPQDGARRQTSKGREGHGRKLTPTYELKTKGEPRAKKHGAAIVEGGVVGFDMGSYALEPKHSGPDTPNRSRIRGVISAALTIAIVFVLLTAVLAGQERLSDYSHQNAALEKSIRTLEESISKLKMQVALEEDLGNIQERAQALGMTHPANEQVQYVQLETTDTLKEKPSLVLQDTPVQEAPTNGLIENIIAWFSSLFSGTETAA